MENLYQGFELNAGAGSALGIGGGAGSGRHDAAASADAESFYRAFVQERRPVVLPGYGLCTDLCSTLTNDFLR